MNNFEYEFNVVGSVSFCNNGFATFGNTGHETVCKKYFFRFLIAEKLLADIEEDESTTSPLVFSQPPASSFDSRRGIGDKDASGSMNNLSRQQLATS